ncbi:hypothetical protein H6F38_21030 [Paenibacillus sp. EKM208P]|nr:hypothetical protein H6F38_21030 [Paenibacillus sp. EKM208P]
MTSWIMSPSRSEGLVLASTRDEIRSIFPPLANTPVCWSRLASVLRWLNTSTSPLRLREIQGRGTGWTSLLIISS